MRIEKTMRSHKGILNQIKEELKDWTNIFKQKDFWLWYLVYTIFGLFLVLIYLLFKDNPAYFWLNVDKTYFWTFLTQSYYHNEAGHFLGNIKSYFILMTVNYLVFYKEKLQRIFRKLFLGFILIVPLLSGILTYIFILGDLLKTQNGASDIVAAFLGLSVISVLILTRMNNRKKGSIFMIIYSVLLLITLVFQSKFGSLFALMFFVPLYLLILISFLQTKKWANTCIAIIFLGLLTYYTLGGYSLELIPETNVFSHVIGVSYGLLAGYYLVVLKKGKNL
ncbi:hypothetical protein GOV04_05070 [Candidatus Woesearchaeota archaeon]|nr:hypothetical protein [Candidatus Woesearchaeota archaeon]